MLVNFILIMNLAGLIIIVAAAVAALIKISADKALNWVFPKED